MHVMYHLGTSWHVFVQTQSIAVQVVTPLQGILRQGVRDNAVNRRRVVRQSGASGMRCCNFSCCHMPFCKARGQDCPDMIRLAGSLVSARGKRRGMYRITSPCLCF